MENVKEIDIIITLIAGTLVMFILASVIVFAVIKYQKRVLKQKEILRVSEKKFQNDLLDATLSATENERQAIAKNMHDEIGTLINVIKLNNSKLKMDRQNPDLVLDLITSNNQILAEIDENVKSISNDLISPTLQKLGFIKGIKQLCLQINKSNTIGITVDSGELTTRFTGKVEVQLYRVCKEVLNNILKHSKASQISIQFYVKESFFSVLISHNGNGINNEDIKILMQNSKGLGLKSIFSRLQVLGGEINYRNNEGRNAETFIQIPIKEENNAYT